MSILRSTVVQLVWLSGMIYLAIAMFRGHTDGSVFSRLFYLSEILAPAVAFIFLAYLCYTHKGRLTPAARTWFYALAMSVSALYFPLLGIATIDVAKQEIVTLTTYVIGVLSSMGLMLDALSYFINVPRDE